MALPPQDKFRLVGTTLDRKFSVERLVTEGGFGVLYQGTHLMLDRPIALKVLKIPTDYGDSGRASFIDGFAREAKTIVRISHPNIVQVLDFGVSPMPSGEMSPWMALEWLNGPTLREALIQRRGRRGQSPQEVLAILRPVLEALAYAHEEGIAHRDIKPANMMLVPMKRATVLKLLDFGIAKAMEHGEEAGSGLTQTTSSLNAFSLAYAAPEQIGGSRTGPWTDVHAMALIITEMLTDMAPYDGKERTEICVDALSTRRPTPAKRNIDAGPWEAVLTRALSLRPAERFPNAGELLRALDSTLPAAMSASGLHVAAPPVTPSGSYLAAPPTGTSYAPAPPPAAFAATFADGTPVLPDIAQNPTTLRGMTTGAQPFAPPRSNSARSVLVVSLSLIGIVGLGAAAWTQVHRHTHVGPIAAIAPNIAAAPAVPTIVPAAFAPSVPVAAAPIAAPTPVPLVQPELTPSVAHSSRRGSHGASDAHRAHTPVPTVPAAHPTATPGPSGSQSVDVD